MTKKPRPEDAIKQMIDDQIIDPRSGLSWEECADALEEIAEHAQGAADAIREEHKHD